MNKNMEIKVIKNSISRQDLIDMENEGFGDFVKAAVDISREIMAVGGELHADEEILLMEKENSRRENTWGINIYPKKAGDKLIEFDSMINIRPSLGNRSRNVENPDTREIIKKIVRKLITD